MTELAVGVPTASQGADVSGRSVTGWWQHETVTTSSSSEMVGRQADLAWLEGLLDQAREGAPRTGLLGGEAGIGKTRLLAEFVGRLGPDVRVLAGQSVDLGDVASPYAPVKAALRTLVADLGAETVLDAVGPGRPALIALLPELAASDAERGASANGGPEAAGRLHEAIAVLLETVSRDRPTVLVIEDLHWIDAATLALLRFLMRALTSSRVLIVLTYRSEDVGRGHPVRGFLSEMERDRWVDRRELSRLTRPQVKKLAKLLQANAAGAAATGAAGESPADAVVDNVFRRSEGVPFFVEELVGIDECDDESALPDTLRDLLLVRYERLSDEAQALLRLVSTGGVRVSHALLESVFAGSPDDLDRAAREAVVGECSRSTATSTHSGTRSCARRSSPTSCRASGRASTPPTPRRTSGGRPRDRGGSPPRSPSTGSARTTPCGRSPRRSRRCAKHAAPRHTRPRRSSASGRSPSGTSCPTPRRSPAWTASSSWVVQPPTSATRARASGRSPSSRPRSPKLPTDRCTCRGSCATRRSCSAASANPGRSNSSATRSPASPRSTRPCPRCATCTPRS
ncbi:hypothetical protein ET445_03280 [Agromyces protaetiae]|uniref:Orc1-like AAA ATPase domain-containing protein n=1 Tax=Agromyces protaetiae TaxID=2509455 RepID=A0A4P6FFH5_9MICO|nr:hypothetical protein ET445_03280 [Agromyces protaetiae]